MVGGALLGEKHAVHGLLEFGARREVGDTVVSQGARQPHPEGFRQILLLDVEGVQVGVEVLTRAVHLLIGRLLLVGRAVAREITQVRESGHQRKFAVQQIAVGGLDRLARP